MIISELLIAQVQYTIMGGAMVPLGLYVAPPVPWRLWQQNTVASLFQEDDGLWVVTKQISSTILIPATWMIKGMAESYETFWDSGIAS